MQFQIPPTPTPFVAPADAVIVELPDMSLWDSAPEAIGVWNGMPTITIFFQALIIAGIAAGFVTLFIHLANKTARDYDA